ncbi:MAG: hypothetical protein ABSD56_05310 [Bryobacteraceae bacterium]
MSSHSAALALAMLFAATAIAADEAKPSLKLVNSVVQVISGPRDEGVADLVVQAENFPKDKLGRAAPTVRDLGVPATPAVQIPPPRLVRELSRGESGAIWLYKLTVSGLPGQSSLARKLLLVLGGEQFTVDYTLANKPAAAFSWSFLAPPVWNLFDSSVAEVPVIVKDVPATGIRVLQSTLTRQGERALSIGTQNLELCANRDGECQPPGTIGPSDSRTLYLRMNHVGNGTYTGNVVIRCDQKPEGDTIALTANVTTSAAQRMGVVALTGGVLLYFLAVVLARWRLAKNSRQELVLLLLKQVEEVKRDSMRMLDAAPDWAKEETEKAFGKIGEDLQSKTNLNPVMPGPFDPDAKMDEFKAHLQRVGLRLESLRVVVEAGMSEIPRAWNLAGADTPKQGAVKNAAHGLLKVPDGQISAADTKKKVDGILGDLFNQLGATLSAGLTVADVGMQLQHVMMSSAGWTWLVLLVWGASTILTGAMAMVLSKAGFGTPMDFGYCVLWGLGLPAAGTQLSQLSAAGIGPKFGVTLPKAAS